MVEIEKTADGSNTLYVPELNEHYHSVKGALTESEHIFINMGLNHLIDYNPDKKNINILEIGFGTGLNTFLTILESLGKDISIFYTSIEKYPLSPETIKILEYPELISAYRQKEDKQKYKEIFSTIHSVSWNTPQKITENFTLEKIEADFTQYPFKEGYDIIYFDAFAPEKQPEMWQQCLFDMLFKILNINGILTTYCSKGVVRRMLQSAGFTVERLPGPPGGKREILRGTKK